jgi:hypothetical protein
MTTLHHVPQADFTGSIFQHRQTLRTQLQRFAESFPPSQQSLLLPACFQKNRRDSLKVRMSVEFAFHLSSSQCVHERVALYPGRTAGNSCHVFISHPELTDGINAHATIGNISAFCKVDKCPPD